MADTGWLSPGTITEDTSVGNEVFINPSNFASTVAATYATIDWSSGTRTSSRLKATNFPVAAALSGKTVTINGFQIQYAGSKDGSTDGVETTEIHIIKADGTLITGTNLADTGVWTNGTNPIARGPVGGASNLCGYTGVTQANVEDTDFGVSFRMGSPGGGTTPDGQTNAVQIKIYYTEVAGTFVPSLIMY